MAAFKPIWATFELFGRTLRVGAPDELHIDLKLLGVTGTSNRREKVGHKRGTYPHDFPIGFLPPCMRLCTGGISIPNYNDLPTERKGQLA